MLTHPRVDWYYLWSTDIWNAYIQSGEHCQQYVANIHANTKPIGFSQPLNVQQACWEIIPLAAIIEVPFPKESLAGKSQAETTDILVQTHALL